MKLECGVCGAGFRGRQHWEFDHGYGRCRECCLHIINDAVCRPDNGLVQIDAEISRRALRGQWPEIEGDDIDGMMESHLTMKLAGLL